MMTRRLTLAVLLALAGLTGQVAAFYPRAVAAEAAAPASRTLDYRFPSGVTYWTNPIVIEGQVGMTITGTRTNGIPSRMVYRGPPTLAPIQFIGCTRCKLIDLEIIDEAACDAGILLANAVDPPNDGYSTGCEIRNVRVLLSGNGKASRRAFSVDSFAAGGSDANNDHHKFEDCYAQSYTEAGFYINGGQCHDITFTRCAAHDAGGRKPIGLHSVSGVFFVWNRGAANSNSADFRLGSAELQCVIAGHNSENSAQFLKADFNGEAFVRVTDVRWEGKPVAGRPVIDVIGPGPWSLTNCFFAGTNGVCPTFKFNGPSPGSLDVSGVMVRQHLGTVPTVAVMTCPTGWELRQHGLKFQQILATGARVTKVVTVNKALSTIPVVIP